jgi:23S rRNA (uracil1939-C5)-methyltransferase
LTSSDTAPKRSPALRAGAEIELRFTDLLANGQGVGRAEGMVVFCFGPLPSEIARVRIREVKQRYAVAEMIERLSNSPQRAQPFCPVFGICGGCQLQHLDYAAQLQWKREVVGNALRRIGGFDGVEVRPAIGMNDPRAYRNKMSLVVDTAADPPALGFYRQRSHDVVTIGACPVLRPQLDDVLQRLDALRDEAPVQRMLADARHVVARSADATNQVVLTVTTERRSESAARAAALLIDRVPTLAGLTNSFDLGSSNAILGRHHRALAGDPAIEETIGGVRYRVSSGSFFQVNLEMVGNIFEFFRPHLVRPRRLVDLYCGVGTFALYFAKHGWSVVGVEENAQALAEAVANARLNGLEERVAFVTGRVEEAIGTAKVEVALSDADVVFMDPPRKGCDEVTLGAIGDAGVPDVWYLSCDPATLARDLKFLVAKGYRLKIVQPFDMFPQTGHVETLVRLEYSDLVSRHH